jgi:hypothetical protein
VAIPDVVARGGPQKAPLQLRPSQVPKSQTVPITIGSGARVTLVAPSKISVDGPLVQRRSVSLTSLTLNFPGDPGGFVHGTPEPSTVLLLAAAVGAVLFAGRRARG